MITEVPEQNINGSEVRVMATVPGQLIWEIVKKNNSFLVKEFGNGTQSVQFSKEPNNLYNLNSYKHSGLANKKTVTIQPAGMDQAVLLATTKTKKQGKPATLFHKSVLKKEFYRMAKTVINQVADNHYRPDLKNAALARLSAVNRSIKVSKSGAKKKNRQASKIHAKQCFGKQPLERVRKGSETSKTASTCQVSSGGGNKKNKELEKEVEATIEIGKLLGIKMDGFQDQVRDMILEQGFP
ncbi:hypothetical protein QVD17_11108 [Tagetes erecta]|uniref:Ribosomal eL28/Mak16 domain-containing protein n=1 Tax=Tagetes erecta TaxID=13708 RepID=A0AAD8L2E9_TARER|nr:hypothetical protein QVD17_11108 [Tagetes erecta]